MISASPGVRSRGAANPGVGVGVSGKGVTGTVGVRVGVAGINGINRARPMCSVSPGCMPFACMIQSIRELWRSASPLIVSPDFTVTIRPSGPGVVVGPAPPNPPTAGINSSWPTLSRPSAGKPLAWMISPMVEP